MFEGWSENLAGFPSFNGGGWVGGRGTWQAAEGLSLGRVAQSLGRRGDLLCHILPICKMRGLEN